MDDLQKEALRTSRVFLVTNLMPETLWDHLVANNVFTDMMLEYVKCKSPRSEQIRSLLSDLGRRHFEAYEGFLTCLEESGHEHCAKEIRNNMAKLLIEKGRSPIMTETLDPNPESGPTLGVLPQDVSMLSSNVDVEMRDCNSPSGVQESLQNSGSNMFRATHPFDYRFFKEKDATDVYKMESDPRGFVYIINNMTFQHMENREGSEKDRDNLNRLFVHLGFEVNVDNDLTASQMRIRLLELSKYERLSTVDSCIIVILSHGSRHRVFGVDATLNEGDSNVITDDYLKDIFSNRNCERLHGKPKLFLIQACRGSNLDQGIPSLPSNPSSQSSKQDGSFVNRDINMEPPSPQETMVSPTEAASSLPSTTDMVISHSSVDGFVSYRSEDGSVFINEVIKVFRERAHDTHVMDMLTKVSQRVATDFATNQGNKMMPQPTSLLLRKWYLNPVNQSVNVSVT